MKDKKLSAPTFVLPQERQPHQVVPDFPTGYQRIRSLIPALPSSSFPSMQNVMIQRVQNIHIFRFTFYPTILNTQRSTTATTVLIMLLLL